MPKEILILFGALFLIILFLGNVSAVDICWVEASSADCITNNGEIVMSISDATNAHGALAGQGTFIPVLCCNFGEGDTTCTVDNKIIGLSSSTNAHAESPSLIIPNYAVDACYDSLKNCRRTDVSCSIGEVEVLYISDLTNAHIEEAGLQSQNYDSKICCVIELLMACVLTSAEWQYPEALEGSDVGTIVNGTGCIGVEISFEVFRGATSCDSIDGCENPSNVVFAAGSNSVAGTWSAGPYHDNEYSLVAKVVANPDETVTSSEPNLLVIAECPYDPEPVICSDYTTESHCNPNICDIDVQDSVPSDVDCSDSGINCECVWENNECKASWSSTGYCGDGIIDAGETCDGSDWGDITGCSNFDVFTGGSLTCGTEDCQFDTSLCTGGTGGWCGDGVVDAGETCDGSDWGDITGCSNFDVFTGGSLTCGTEDCQFDTSLCTGSTIGICNDGDINTGEQCDGSDWGDITGCSNFDDFTGGSLSCGTDCNFDTSLCTGGTGGWCGDGVVDAGETCDGSDWGDITGCSNFDIFTGGTLMCADCQFDTSQCTGGIEGAEIGICIYTQFTDDTCDDGGFLTFSWTTEWIWSGECDAICQSQPQNLALKTKCDNDDGLTDSLACPAQIPLPFFNIYSFVAALTIIALIYVILILRKEKRKR